MSSEEGKEQVDELELYRILGRMFIGHSLDDVKKLAKALDITFRISCLDGKTFILTRDFRPERINLIVMDNEVKETHNG